MAEIVEFFGEEVVGDGYSFVYSDNKFVRMFEYGEEAGYLEAKKEDGHTVKHVRLEEGESGLDWSELADWWEERRFNNVTSILADAEETKLEVTITED